LMQMWKTETDGQTMQWKSRETENESINNSETKSFREKREPLGTNYRWGDTKTEKLIGRDRWHESWTDRRQRDRKINRGTYRMSTE
jgi:hypothetical protein